MRVLIVTAVEAEKEAVLRGLRQRGGERFDVAVSGVGPAAAAAETALALAAVAQSDAPYALAVSAGIGGGFAGRADVGDLVVATAMIAADLGAETPEGFRGVDELGFGPVRIPADELWSDRIAEALRAAGLPVRRGSVLTVSTATGTTETAERLAARHPDAAAEGMEGFGVAAAARRLGVLAVEIRAVSNRVGPRDRSAWRIEEALDRLAAACAVLASLTETD
ncbi:MAG TPA: futalosine hydrolase [Paenibacillaceae bacterium]